jgi:hypothetical protein
VVGTPFGCQLELLVALLGDPVRHERASLHVLGLLLLHSLLPRQLLLLVLLVESGVWVLLLSTGAPLTRLAVAHALLVDERTEGAVSQLKQRFLLLQLGPVLLLYSLLVQPVEYLISHFKALALLLYRSLGSYLRIECVGLLFLLHLVVLRRSAS